MSDRLTHAETWGMLHGHSLEFDRLPLVDKERLFSQWSEEFHGAGWTTLLTPNQARDFIYWATVAPIHRRVPG